MNTLQLILAVIELVKIVEKLMPEGGNGQAKLAAVRGMVEQAVGDISAMWPQIEQVIAVFVKIANATGAFKK